MEESYHNPPLGEGGKIFVTGGTGFLGAYIIKELVEKGYAVRALRRHNNLPFFIPSSIFEKVEWFPGDILDIVALEEAMNGADAVIHSAAKISFSKKDKRDMFHTNIEGTANVINTAIGRNVPRLVHVSSVAALGRHDNGVHVNEEKKWTETRLNTNYAISKYYSEMEVWRGLGEGLNGVIINPTTILGYGDWNRSSCAIFKSIYQEFPWYSNGVNGFVDVEDVARAAILLMETNIQGERFIINGDNWSFRQLFNTIADGFGKRHPPREATPFMTELALRLEKIRSLFNGYTPLLTRESARVARAKTWCDNSKLLNALQGFAFTPLQESIRKACEKYANKQQVPSLAT